MNRLLPITYSQLKRWLKRNHNRITVFTLGGSSYIILTLLDNDSICITGSNGKSILIGESIWEQAMVYITSIHSDNNTWKAAEYARPNVICPELADKMNFGPTFPAVCKAYWYYHKR